MVRVLLFCLIYFFLPSVFAQSITPSALSASPGIPVPVVFELNQGQLQGAYRFLARNTGGEVRFTDSGPDFVMRGRSSHAVIHLRPVGAAAQTRVEGRQPLQAKANYLIGRDASRWIRNVSTFAEVAYGGIYPGVDLLFYGSKDRLEHDFVVSPHSDPSNIRFTLTDADQIEVNDSGDLVASVAGEEVILRKPVAYQEADGKRIEVESAFRLDLSQSASGPIVSFQLGHYDPDRQLIIDPVLIFSTYLGGTHADIPAAIATDSSGNIYVAGSTRSPDYPLVSAYRSSCSTCTDSTFDDDAYISKLDPTGHTLLYSTYFGGSGEDEIDALAIDSSGNLVATGYTSSTDFPSAGNFRSSVSSGVFAVSLDATGSSLNFSEIVGTANSTYGAFGSHRFALSLDSSNNLYIAGLLTAYNGRPNFPVTSGSYGSGAASFGEALFALKLASNGTQIYGAVIPSTSSLDSTGTYLGGIAVDPQGNLYISGTTAGDLPATGGALLTILPQGAGAAGFLLGLNPTASALTFATYLPGTDSAGPVARAADGSLFVTGETRESNLPVAANAFQKTLSTGCACNSGYILHIDSTGSAVLGATYLSGSIPSNMGTNFGTIALDNSGDIFVGGVTDSTDFPVVNPIVSFLDEIGNLTSGGTIIAGLSPDLSTMAFGSYFNGNGAGSKLSAMTVSSTGRLVFAGTTFSNSNFVTTDNAYQPNAPASPTPYTGYIHQFLSSIDLTAAAPSACFDTRTAAFAATPANTASYATIHLTNCGNAPLTLQSVTPSSPLVGVSQPCVTVAVGATCALQFSFTPVSSAPLNGTVTLLANTTIPTQVLYATGQGVAPQLSTAASVSLGQSLVASATPIAVTLYVKNAGNAVLSFSGISVTGDFAILANSCISTLSPSSYMGCTIRLGFTPTAAGLRSGTLTINSNDPVAPQTNIALSGTGLVAYSVPVLTGLSATTQIMSTTSVPITLTGSNFFPQSVVLINGQPATTIFNSGTSLTATIPASFLASIGELSLTVSNPTPGGGESLPQLLTVFQSLTLTPSFLVSVPSTGMLYASIPNSTIINPNTVIPISAATGTVGTPIPVGRNPVILAASTDGKYLYVALAGDQAIQRINLQTQAIERTFPFPANICTTCGPAAPVDLQVVPGNSQEVVLSQGNMLTLFNDSGMVNYVPGSTSLYYMAPFNSLAFAGNPQSIYSLPFTIVQNSFFGTVTMDADGLHYTPVTGTNYGGNNTTGSHVVSDGTLLYTNSGEVWNPATAIQTGTFPVTVFYTGNRNLTLDTTLDKIYLIGYQSLGNSYTNVLTAYSKSSLAVTGTLAFPQINGIDLTDLVRWGSNGFAFLGSGNVYILRSSIASPLAVNPLPTLISISPLSAKAGAPAFTLTLNGTNFLSSSTVTWNGTLLPVTYLSGTQLTVSVPASAIAASGTAEIMVSNPSPGGGSSTALPFDITGLTAPTVTITSSANPVLLQNPVTIAVSTDSTATGMVTFMDGTAVLGSAALANGVAAYTSSSLAVGSHIITASYSGDTNFLPAAATFTQIVQDFSLTLASSGSASQTAQRGGTAIYSLLVNPSGVALPTAMSLTVSGLPPGAIATFSPSSLAAGAGSTPVTLTIQIPATLAEHRRERTLGGVVSLAFALMIMPFIRRRRAFPRQFLLIICSGLIASLLLGCGSSHASSDNSTPPASKTYTLTVTGTAGANTHTTTLTLIVS